MPQEFEGQDLSDAVFWGVDLSRAHFRDVKLDGVTIANSWVSNLDVDAVIDNVTINGVDVTAYVNEHDAWYPLRAILQPRDPAGMRATWAALDETWAATIARARALPEQKLHEQVDGEYSFVETLQHVVFGIDKWFTVPVLGERFDPIVLPNRGSDALDWPGRDRDAKPTFPEALTVRDERVERVREYLARVTDPELAKDVEVMENGANSVRTCMHVLFEEAFAHNRYALRDLARLA